MPGIPLDQDNNASKSVIPSDLRAAKACEQEIIDDVERHGYHESCAFAIKLALEEAITNAIRHGNGNDPTKHITVRWRVTPEAASIWLADDGDGFCPNTVPDPTLDENLNKPHGRGLMLMRADMDEVGFNEAGNEVRMVKLNRA